MPSVLMPDGVNVELPDNPTPDQINSLKAIRDKLSVQKPVLPKDTMSMATGGASAPVGTPSGTPEVQTGKKLLGTAMKAGGKPLLEFGGAAFGGALGTAAEPGGGTVAGGMLGYLAGRKASDFLEQYAGTQPKRSVEGEIKTSLKDVRDSLLMETAGPAMSKAGELGKVAVGKLTPEWLSKRLYEGIAKWSTTLTLKAKQEITDTVLKEKIPFNETGYQKVMENVTKLNEGVDSVIMEKNVPLPGREPSAPGQIIPRQVAQGEVAGAGKITEGQLKSPETDYFTSGQFEKPTTTATSMTAKPTSGFKPTEKLDPKKYPDMDAIMAEAKKAIGLQKGKIQRTARIKAAEDYINQFYKDFDGQMDLALAQSLKKDANRQLDAFFNAFKKGEFRPQTAAETDALNGIRAGLQKEIERLAPEVKPMNERLGKLLDVQAPLMRATGRDANRNPITLSEWLATGLGESVGGIPGAVAGFVGKKVLGSASMVSKAAIKLDEAKNMPEVKEILQSGVGQLTQAARLRRLGYSYAVIQGLTGKNQ